MKLRSVLVPLTAFALLFVLVPSFATGAKKNEAPAAPAVTSEMLRGLSWRSIGPANMGGRISEIALVPQYPRRFFVATGTGGLWRTHNGGTTFSPVFDEQPVQSIGSVAVAPSNPMVVYVGTGEGNGRNSSSWGNGVYKSTDGGDSFTYLGLPESRDIPRLAIHPQNPDVVYAAALGHLWDANRERGLYKTQDGGKTWQLVLHIDENTGCVDVLLDPRNPDVVYAAMYARRRAPWSFQSGGFGDKGGIYKSTDGGRTFRRLDGGLPKKTGRIGLALYAADPGHVYAIVEADDAGAIGLDTQLSKTGGVFRSLDGGEHWTRLHAHSPRGFYFGKIAVDPKDERRLYVPGFGLALSDDGGKTFRGDGAVLQHPDVHTLVIDPGEPGHILMGTDGGVYESWDRAATWRYLDNLPLGQFYELGLGMDQPYTICGGLQDNGTWCGPSRARTKFGETADDSKTLYLSNYDWSSLLDGDGYYAQIDPRDPMLVYGESQEGHLARIDRRTGRVKVLRPQSKEGTPAFRFNWNTPVLLSHHDPEVLYVGGNHVFKLTRRGDAWQTMSPDLSSRDPEKIVTAGSGAETHGTVVALAESPRQAGVLWAGTDDGLVWVTRDDGAHWENVTAHLRGIPKGTYVSRIEASHFDPAVALLGFDGHRTGDNRPYLVETRDFGKSFRELAGGLPAGRPVRVVREDPVVETLLFVGTEFDLLVSFDRGRSWLSLRGDSLPAVQVHDLQIHPRERDLVAGTHGRSIYLLDDIRGLEQMTPENLAKPLVLVEPRLAYGFNLPIRDGMWGHNQFGAKNPPFAVIDYLVKEHESRGAKLVIKDASGQQVRELKGKAERGLNRIEWDLTREKQQQITEVEASLGQTALVPSGEYALELVVGKHKVAGKLAVKHLPGVDPEPLQ